MVESPNNELVVCAHLKHPSQSLLAELTCSLSLNAPARNITIDSTVVNMGLSEYQVFGHSFLQQSCLPYSDKPPFCAKASVGHADANQSSSRTRTNQHSSGVRHTGLHLSPLESSVAGSRKQRHPSLRACLLQARLDQVDAIHLARHLDGTSSSRTSARKHKLTTMLLSIAGPRKLKLSTKLIWKPEPRPKLKLRLAAEHPKRVNGALTMGASTKPA